MLSDLPEGCQPFLNFLRNIIPESTISGAAPQDELAKLIGDVPSGILHISAF
jgi:hypothetical protein